MRIVCNGETRETEPGNTVERFILDAGLDPETVVVECDGRILTREEYTSRRLADGMRLELIRFVGGG